MGRPVFYRQRVRSQAASVQAKSLLTHLASEIRARREVSPEEAWLIALDTIRFLEQGLLAQGPGQIMLPCVAGLESHFRRARRDQTEKLVKLTVLADEDASLLEEFGTGVMQQARLARVIEEAYAQEALLDGHRLCLLMPLTLVALRERLKPFWQQGVLLPLAGMTRAAREQMRVPRAVLAVERYLRGEDLTAIRRELAVSRLQWSRWWRGFQDAVAQTPALLSDFPAELIAGWQELWPKYREHPASQERLGKQVPLRQASAPVDEEERLRQRLEKEHGYTPASTRQFMQELRDLAIRLKNLDRRPGQVITFGVAADEPPGRSLNEARLCLVVLDYITPEDWGAIKRTSPQELKWQRLERLATQAYAQGVALSLADLAHLLGISTDAIQNTMKKHDQVLLPTRGRVADMGATLSHAEKIIALYMDGYTETEIKRRTGHSYDSIENYLWNFSRVICLTERGMPLPAIRQALGMSRRVVTKYLNLYELFNHPDFAFRMARVRRMVENGNPKKNGR
jgi:biotin operon repressor